MGIFDFFTKKERKIPTVSKIRRAYIKKDCEYCRGFMRVYNRILATTPRANAPDKLIEIVDINTQWGERDYAFLASEMAGEGRNLSVPIVIFEGIMINGIILGAESSYEIMLREIMGVPQ